MPRISHSKENSKRASLRRCTTCQRIGHNARTCISLQTNELPAGLIVEQKKSAPAPKIFTTPGVVVTVGGEAPVSPHVISLKLSKRETDWEKAGVYQPEKGKKKSERPVADFAYMVREANKIPVVRKKVRPEAVSVIEQEGLKKPSVDILKEILRVESSDAAYVIEPTISFRPLPKLIEKKQVKTPQKKNKKILFSFSHIPEKLGNYARGVQESFKIKKFMAAAAIMCVIAVIPFPALGLYRKVEGDTEAIVRQSTNAFLSLQASTVAAINQDIPQAELDLTTALSSFGSARALIDKEYKALVYVMSALPVVGTKIQARQDLLEAGHYVALGNAYLIKGLDEAVSGNASSTIDRMKIIRTHLRGAVPQYDAALAKLENIDNTSLPPEFQESFGEFRKLFGSLVRDMNNMEEIIGGVELMLGSEGIKRYLIVFQNQYELRPTGGFIGSFAVVDIQNGKIQNITVPGGGSYDLQGQLSAYVKPPVPLQLLNGRWEFQDANWFPDFEASAEKLAWFYQKSRNATVDGVIAVNASVLPRLLRVLGPIENEQYGILLDADSAIENLHEEIESYDNATGENKPKAVLSSVLEQMLGSLSTIEPHEVANLLTELAGAMSEREIQVYMEDKTIEKKFDEFGWTGKVLATSPMQDYLMVVHANVGGGKSDANIEEKIQHQSLVEEDGSIVDTVLITRRHTGSNDPDSFMGQFNSSYIRVYVPEGAELIDAGGFVYPDESSFRVPPEWYRDDEDLSRFEKEESVHVGTGTRIVKEFGKTSFGNWVVTYPGEETHVYFTYRLPFGAFGADAVEHSDKKASAWSVYKEKIMSFAEQSSDTSRYSLMFQKQSGNVAEYSHTIIYPDGWRPVWKQGDELDLSLNGASSEGPLDTDKVFGVVMKYQE